MAATVTGSKTVTYNLAPHLSASTLTHLLATAPENLTVFQVKELLDAIERTPGGSNPGATLGSIFH
ncbi:MAG: hypothetical protein JOZ32_21180 [Bryobacterales bacterium]|nr:hypothetical protein [Bryobacterales bacterium]